MAPRGCSALLLLLLLAVCVIGTGRAATIPSDINEDILIDEAERAERVRRDLTDLVPLLGSLVQMPGLNSINLQELLQTAITFVQNGLDEMRCCQGVGVPNLVLRAAEECVRTPLNSFIARTKAQKRAGKGSMVETVVKEADILQLVNTGLCSMKCTYDSLNLTTSEGLPSSELMTEALSDIVKGDAIVVLEPALHTCALQLSRAKERAREPLQPDGKCWASISFTDCMRSEVYENCPESRKQRGTDCLIKMGRQFWADLPTKAQELYDAIKSIV